MSQRPPSLRLAIEEGLVIDGFAGGGGASTGIEEAIGRPVDIAINHDPVAIACHQANHPNTRHYLCDIWEVDPIEATQGKKVALAWFSPDCTHFSRARGDVPRQKNIRSLAWVVINWARDVSPAMIAVENVDEFQTWGPLDDDGYPIKSRAGETFNEWLATLRSLGYSIEFRSIVAADHGAPTIRKRLYLVARLDGIAPAFPEATHGVGRPNAWRPAHEVIDWSLQCPSIFERPRPLAEATMRRIAAGLRRYVVEAKRPFLVGAVAPFVASHYGASVGRPATLPLATIAGNQGHEAVVAPSLIKYHGGQRSARGQRMDEPLRTADGSNRFAMLAPSIVPITHTGSSTRCHSIDEPVRTITTASRGELALSAPYFVRHGHYSTRTGAGLLEGCGAGTFRGQSAERPHSTVCATNDRHVVAPFLAPLNSEDGHKTARSRSVERPHSTVMASSAKHMLMAPALLRHYGGEVGQELERPLGAVTARDHHALAAAWVERFYGSATSGRSADLPLPTVTAGGNKGGGHIAEVRAFLVKYYSHGGSPKNQQQSLFDPLHTVTAKARMGLVTIHGEPYQIVDIGMRMLQPHELFAAQGFPADYIIDLDIKGKRITKTDQIRLAGNSVCPDVARAIVDANLRAA